MSAMPPRRRPRRARERRVKDSALPLFIRYVNLWLATDMRIPSCGHVVMLDDEGCLSCARRARWAFRKFDRWLTRREPASQARAA